MPSHRLSALPHNYSNTICCYPSPDNREQGNREQTTDDLTSNEHESNRSDSRLSASIRGLKFSVHSWFESHSPLGAVLVTF
jgi:hypothetical protein